MTPLGEVGTGSVDDAFVALVTRTVMAVGIGRLVARIGRASRESDRFAPAGEKRCKLVDCPVDPSGADPEPLAAAVAVIPISVQQWSTSANRRGPFADRRSIEAMLAAAFEAAENVLGACKIRLDERTRIHDSTIVRV